MLQQGLVVALCGVGAGLTLTWMTVEVVNALLGGSGSNGPTSPNPNGGSQISLQLGTEFFGGHTFAILIIAVLVVTMIAAYLPARRASRVDPNIAPPNRVSHPRRLILHHRADIGGGMHVLAVVVFQSDGPSTYRPALGVG